MRSDATKQSHHFKVKIVTLPLVARNDNIIAFIMFALAPLLL
jgi:hypothetical protein